MGNDSLVGSNGGDTLGGDGADHFVFGSLNGSTADTDRDHITDFVKGTDLIDLSGFDAQRGVAGDQAFGFIAGGGAFTGTKGEPIRSTRARTPSSRATLTVTSTRTFRSWSRASTTCMR